MYSPDTHELAWAAGFFDGEGNMRVSRNGKYKQLVVQIAQTTKYVLKRFQRAVGIGNVNGPYKHRDAGDVWSKFYRFTIASFEGAQHVVAVLWKYLSPVKRRQCREALADLKDYSDGIYTFVRLTAKNIDSVKILLNNNVSKAKIARKFGVSWDTIRKYELRFQKESLNLNIGI